VKKTQILYIINFRSVEGRGIFGLKIGNSPLVTKTRAVWIDGGIHARSVFIQSCQKFPWYSDNQ